MEKAKRVKQVVNWLIFKGVAENEKGVADLLGYTKSSFSQLVNGRVPVSERFIKGLCSLDPDVNFVWLQTGEGEMFLSGSLNSEEVTLPASAWAVIQRQAESLSARDSQINELISMLRDQFAEIKKMTARQEGAGVVGAG